VNRPPEPEVVIEGGEPIDRQLESQIRGQIRAGVLRPGEELPTVRAVSVALAIRPRAVEAAYGRLEREGLLRSGELCGPRVAHTGGMETRDLERLCHDFLGRTLDQGYSLADVSRVLHACLERGDDYGEPY
jgi:GntR family transcriptional regulator